MNYRARANSHHTARWVIDVGDQHSAIDVTVAAAILDQLAIPDYQHHAIPFEIAGQCQSALNHQNAISSCVVWRGAVAGDEVNHRLAQGSPVTRIGSNRI